MCRYNQVSTGAEINLNSINSSDQQRNRGIEVLLYRREQTVQEKTKPVIYKFNLRKLFSIFNREFNFQVDFVIKSKQKSREGQKC